MAKTLRWGILGCGNIARKFAQGLESAEGAELVAVGSRTQAKADEFGEQFGAARRHGGYEALASDTEVDAIYVATPHSAHMDNSILCLEAGKAVLCEKPFTINAEQARKVAGVARAKGAFCMEAMWTRFVPTMVRLRELLAEKVIGDIRMIQADFGFRARFNPEGRLFKPELGGGGLLDVGVYPVSLSSMILGKPSRITGLAEIGETGVDEQAGMVLGYEGGALALLATGVRTSTPQEADILGADGRIRIHPAWWRPEKMTVLRAGEGAEEIHLPLTGNGYNYEAEEVARCLAAGKTESDVMPLDESISIVETMDELRRQWGVKYPME